MKRYEYEDIRGDEYEYGTLYLGEPEDIKAMYKSMKRAWWRNDKFTIPPEYERPNYNEEWRALLVVEDTNWADESIGFYLVSNDFVVKCLLDDCLKEITHR